jgi:hypothetical protein
MNKGIKAFVLMTIMVLALGMVPKDVKADEPIGLNVEYVEVNDVQYDPDEEVIAEEFARGEELDILVKVVADQGRDVMNAQIEAYISGYRYSQYERDLVSDVTRTFDLYENRSKSFRLNLEIPTKMDKEDVKLRIRVSDPNSESVEFTYQLTIAGVDRRDALEIKDFLVSPSDEVEAGRPLSFKVRVKNLGDRELDDVRVRVEIPELGVWDDETIDEIESDDTETFEELLIRIPKDTDAGTYTVRATAFFDEYESSTESMTIMVLEAEGAEPDGPTTVISIPDSQDVTPGTGGAVYPIMISNNGDTARTYTITVSGAEAWGTTRLDPASVVVVPAEGTSTAYLYVAANENAEQGVKAFKVTVTSGSEVNDMVVTANVIGDGTTSYTGLRRGLEIGLIVLVIILIILGLIIGFNKMRDKERPEEEAQTYY